MIRNLDELLKQLTAAYAARLDEIKKVDEKHKPVIDQRVYRLYKECFPKSKIGTTLYPLPTFRKTLNEFLQSVGGHPLPDEIGFDKLIVMDTGVQFYEDNHALKCQPVTTVNIAADPALPNEPDAHIGQIRIPSTIIELHTSLLKTADVSIIPGSSGKILKLS